MARNKSGSILVVDDNVALLNALKLFLKYEFERVHTIKNPNQLPSTLRSQKFDVILLDMNFRAGVNTGNEGLFWLKEILSVAPDAKVILVTAYGDVNLAVKGMQEGAVDFVLKPWDNDKLLLKLKSIVNEGKKEGKGKKEGEEAAVGKERSIADGQIIGESEAIKEVLRTVSKVAATDANVILLGENGTGKELVAQAIHANSKRAGQELVSVDVGSLAETLFESEMFGSVAGAFTDSKAERTGRFREAHGSTLFLDEIGNLPMALQAKLLTVIQKKEVTPLGSNKPEPIDVRLISATNKPLVEMVKTGEFREDLLYRLNTIQIYIPPLRERKEDILLLVDHFMCLYKNKYKRQDISVSQKAMDKLMAHTWPGNIRELRHVIEKAVIMCEKDVVQPVDFQFNNVMASVQGGSSLNLGEVEKVTIIKALQKHKGNLSNSAKELGITRTTLYNKIEKYGITY